MDSSAGFRYKKEKEEEDNPQYVIHLPNYPTPGDERTLIGPFDSKEGAEALLAQYVWEGEVIELWPPDSE